MHWVLWLVVSNIGIFWLEHLYRSGKYPSYWVALPEIILPVLVSQAGLFYGFKLAPSLFFAGALFTLMNVSLRVINTYRLGENLNAHNYIGIILLVIAVFLIKKP